MLNPIPIHPLLLASMAALALYGCTVVAVGAATVGIAASAVGVAADVAVGTAKLAGKGVGAAYGAMTDDKPDNSGLSIKYRESDPNRPWQPQPGMSNAREPDLPTAAPAPQPAAPPPGPAAPRVESVPLSP